jgi:uncharacterized protein involved in exopolysaccharide biosynthesis
MIAALDDSDRDGPSLRDLTRPVAESWRFLVGTSLIAGAIALTIAFVIPPTFTARATFLAPQPQNVAGQALASLGSLANLAGAAGGSALRTPADQYVTLMQSATVADRMIDHFDLMKAYAVELRVDARRQLAENTRIGIGKRDGLITVDVDDHDPRRSADMANRYIEELRVLSARFALSEAQQRRAFFEGLLNTTRADLLKAEAALQASGFSQGVLRAEPRAAADTYARLRAEVSAAEVRVQTLRRALADTAPEFQRSLAQLDALRAQLIRVEQADRAGAPSDYLVRYREFKYQETLFELFARQFEAARVDEAREGLTIQVVDPATPPERKSRPKRLLIAMGTFAAALVLTAMALMVRDRLRSRHVPG